MDWFLCSTSKISITLKGLYNFLVNDIPILSLTLTPLPQTAACPLPLPPLLETMLLEAHCTLITLFVFIYNWLIWTKKNSSLNFKLNHITTNKNIILLLHSTHITLYTTCLGKKQIVSLTTAGIKDDKTRWILLMLISYRFLHSPITSATINHAST